MRALLIGGTGTISTAICHLLVEQGWEVTVLNRGRHKDRLPAKARLLIADIEDEAGVGQLLNSEYFDVVVQFIAFKADQVRRDIRLFTGKCSQYIFISSASAYQKPPANYLITESTPLANPYWQYSRDKIDCENVLVTAYREKRFPVTIVRPSHTYTDWSVPLALHGANGPWQTIKRIMEGKPIVIHGDGTSLWTLTHSRDFAFGFTGLMGNIRAIGEAVHITSDESLTWNQIYQAIGLALSVEPQIFHVATDELVAMKPDLKGPLLGDKSNSVVFDNSKLKQLVPGFCARIRFDQGIRTSLDYLQAHPELQLTDHEWDAFLDQVISIKSS